MKLYIDRKISIAFLVSLTALSFLVWLSVRNNKEFLHFSAEIVKGNAILYHAEQVQSIMVDIESGQRGFIITNDSIFLEPHEAALQNIDQNLVSLSHLLDTSRPEVDRISRLRLLVEEKNAFAVQAILARNENFMVSQSVVSSKEGKKLMDEIRRIVNEIQADQVSKRNDLRISRERAMQRFNFTVVVVIVLACATIAALFFILNRHIAALIRKEEKINQLNTELEAFSYSVSHDLRSPLRVIDGYVSILNEDYSDKLDTEGRKVINVISRNAQRMGQLIDDLLDFSHMSRKQLTRAHLEFREMVARVTNEQRARFNLDTLEVRILPLERAYADMKMMEQVWVNLISNAVKYSSKTRNPVLEIGSYRQNGDVCFYVKDNGVGFDMEFRDKLFGVFQRLHKPEEFPGTGVGLAIVKRIVSRHGGNVWAKARPNEGATFFFSIPD